MPNPVAEPGDNFPAIELPAPLFDDTAPLAQAFRDRRSHRKFSTRMIPPQMLSDLLWAACGVNRGNGVFGVPTDSDATASNAQEIDVYVALEQGLYLYDPDRAWLVPVLAGDLRPMVADADLPRTGDLAPVRLIYVADTDRLENADAAPITDPEAQKSYYFVDCGIVAANVYLYAAAAGLNTWFHDCDRLALAKRLPLRAGRRVLFGQTVGFPG